MLLKHFRAGQVVKITGVKYRTLDYWTRSGFMKPSVQTAKGTGTDRLFSFRDVIAVKVAHELRQAGVSLQALRRVVSYLRRYKKTEQPLAECRLVVKDNDVLWCENDQELISALRSPGQHVFRFVVDLGTVTREIEEAIERIAA